MARQPFPGDPLKHVAVAATAKGDLLVAYLPVGGELTLRTPLFDRARLTWFNPRTGERVAEATPVAPDAADWVLLVSRR